MPVLKKRKTYAEKCPVCGQDLHPLGEETAPLGSETVYFDEIPPLAPILAEVSPGHWVKVIERKPAKT